MSEPWDEADELDPDEADGWSCPRCGMPSDDGEVCVACLVGDGPQEAPLVILDGRPFRQMPDGTVVPGVPEDMPRTPGEARP